ncbi:MAG: hypothetical protein JW384_03900 [Nitrosomonadaceae bacterium]|nr:hypothetical protein [Nitrosomonadaceae bacterium]
MRENVICGILQTCFKLQTEVVIDPLPSGVHYLHADDGIGGGPRINLVGMKDAIAERNESVKFFPRQAHQADEYC